MSTQKWLIIGQGDIGLPVTNMLAQNGASVTGLARRLREHYDLDQQANFLQADALTLRAEQLQRFTRIAVIITPDEYSSAGYQHSYLGICQHLAALSDDLPNLERIVFISSTGVYGQDSGEWIDEHSAPVPPKREGSQYILKAEKTLKASFGDKVVIIRPSGIYGRARLMRLRKAKETPKAPIAASAWSNRIMDRDLVRVIVNVLTLDAPKPLYIATDYLPVTSFELTTWLSAQVGEALPEVDDTKTMVTGKRLHSNIPLAWLDYPDWQAGYRDILTHTAQHHTKTP